MSERFDHAEVVASMAWTPCWADGWGISSEEGAFLSLETTSFWPSFEDSRAMFVERRTYAA